HGTAVYLAEGAVDPRRRLRMEGRGCVEAGCASAARPDTGARPGPKARPGPETGAGPEAGARSETGARPGGSANTGPDTRAGPGVARGERDAGHRSAGAAATAFNEHAETECGHPAK